MGNQRAYNKEYKVQAVKLAHEIGSTKAANKLGIHKHAVWLDVGSKAGKVGFRCRYTDSTNSHESCR